MEKTQRDIYVPIDTTDDRDIPETEFIKANKEFLEKMKASHPALGNLRANNAVLAFIERLRDYSIGNINPLLSTPMTKDQLSETIYMLFHAGYCWHFAHMLQNTFRTGKTCLAYPYGHFVWIYEGVPYDIGGIYDGEAEDFIPETYLGNGILDFLHIPGKDWDATEEEIQSVYERYLSDTEKKRAAP